MPRRMLSPIMSVKHYVHQTLQTVASGAVANIVIADSVIAPATALAFQVSEGSILKAVFVELWIVGIGATDGLLTFNMTVEKSPSNLTNMTFGESVNLGGYSNKKNILYTTQGNMSSIVDGAQPIPLYRAWIKIPKGKQRMGKGDRIVLNINSVGQPASICGIFIYKEYK